MITNITNDSGTIECYASHDLLLLDEVRIEAELDGDSIEITRVFIDVLPVVDDEDPGYQDNLDMTILHKQVSEWETEIIEKIGG